MQIHVGVCVCVGLTQLFWVSVVAFVVDICSARMLSSARVFLILNYSTTTSTCSFWYIFSENCFREHSIVTYTHIWVTTSKLPTHTCVLFRQVAVFCEARAAIKPQSSLYCVLVHIPIYSNANNCVGCWAHCLLSAWVTYYRPAEVDIFFRPK